MSELMLPMCAYFQTIKDEPTGSAFVDSTSLKVCHNIRVTRNRVFADTPERAFISMLAQYLREQLTFNGVIVYELCGSDT